MNVKDCVKNSIVPDKYLSCKDIYYGSKKYDDFERVSSLHYHAYIVSTIGLPNERKEKVIEMRKNKQEVCLKFWRGIKVSFLLNPSSPYLTDYLRCLFLLMKLRIQDLNDEFIRCQDPEVIKYPNPDRYQTLRLNEIQYILRVAKGDV